MEREGGERTQTDRQTHTQRERREREGGGNRNLTKFLKKFKKKNPIKGRKETNNLDLTQK